MAVAPTKVQEDNVFDLPWATIIILLLVAIGGADLLIDGHLSADYEKFITTVAFIIGPLAVGRGLAARKPG